MSQRVLVVEDDPTLRLVIQDNLGSEGYDVDLAADGASAIRQARATTPDLIILDLTLPDCDGLAVLPTLRQGGQIDRKSTRLNSSHPSTSYAVFCLKQKT